MAKNRKKNRDFWDINDDLKQQEREQRKKEMFDYWENQLKNKPKSLPKKEVIEEKSSKKTIFVMMLFIFVIASIGIFMNKDRVLSLFKEKPQSKVIIKNEIQQSENNPIITENTVKKTDLNIFLEKSLNTVEGNKYQLINLGSEEKVGRYNKAKVSYNLKWLDKQGNIYYTDENLSADDWSYFNTPSAWFEVLQMIGVGGKIELYCPIESIIFKDTDLPNQTAFLIEIQLDGIIPLDESPDEELVVKTELEHRNVVELHTKQNTTIRKCSSLYCDVLGLMPKDSVLIPIKDENGQNIIENNWIKVEYNGRFCTNPKDKDCSSRSAVKSVEGWVMDAAL